MRSAPSTSCSSAITYNITTINKKIESRIPLFLMITPLHQLVATSVYNGSCIKDWSYVSPSWGYMEHTGYCWRYHQWRYAAWDCSQDEANVPGYQVNRRVQAQHHTPMRTSLAVPHFYATPLQWSSPHTPEAPCWRPLVPQSHVPLQTVQLDKHSTVHSSGHWRVRSGSQSDRLHTCNQLAFWWSHCDHCIGPWRHDKVLQVVANHSTHYIMQT